MAAVDVTETKAQRFPAMGAVRETSVRRVNPHHGPIHQLRRTPCNHFNLTTLPRIAI
jgi:hypothetical protein